VQVASGSLGMRVPGITGHGRRGRPGAGAWGPWGSRGSDAPYSASYWISTRPARGLTRGPAPSPLMPTAHASAYPALTSPSHFEVGRRRGGGSLSRPAHPRAVSPASRIRRPGASAPPGPWRAIVESSPLSLTGVVREHRHRDVERLRTPTPSTQPARWLEFARSTRPEWESIRIGPAYKASGDPPEIDDRTRQGLPRRPRDLLITAKVARSRSMPTRPGPSAAVSAAGPGPGRSKRSLVRIRGVGPFAGASPVV